MEYVKSLYVGRLNRRTYLYSTLILGATYAIISSIFNGIFGYGNFLSSGITLILVAFLIIIGFSFSVRRFQDLGKSGWLSLLFLIPIVGFFVWLYLIFAKGNEGSNSFGTQPADAFEYNKAIGIKK